MHPAGQTLVLPCLANTGNFYSRYHTVQESARARSGRNNNRGTGLLHGGQPLLMQSTTYLHTISLIRLPSKPITQALRGGARVPIPQPIHACCRYITLRTDRRGYNLCRVQGSETPCRRGSRLLIVVHTPFTSGVTATASAEIFSTLVRATAIAGA